MHARNRQYGIAEPPNTPQKFFLEPPPLNAIRLQSFKMLEGLDDALTAELVQAQNSKRSDRRSAASLNSRWNSGRLADLPLAWSMYSWIDVLLDRCTPG
jgi:hypothetical protein